MTERYAWVITVTGWDGEFEAAWREGSKAVQAHPGARGTTLYRLPHRPHEYMAVAEWDTRQARDDAVTETPDANTRYGRVTILGWLEEVAKVEPAKDEDMEQRRHEALTRRALMGTSPELASEPSGTVFIAADGYCAGCGRYVPDGERRWLLLDPNRPLCRACHNYEKARTS